MQGAMLARHLSAWEKRKPLLEMTADELVQAYMSPLTLGVFLSFFLYGMFLLSLYLYGPHFKRDTWVNRSVVVLLACFTLVDTVAGGIRIFKMTVLFPNNLTYILDVTQRPEDWICTLMMLATVLVCQLFMSFRIISFAKHMSEWAGPRARLKRGLMAAGLGLGWIACFGVSAANCVIFYKTTNYMQLLLPTSTLARAFRLTTLLQPCILCFMDILIAVLMSVQYRKAKTGFGVSNHILEVLINVVIRNGVLVAVVMVVQFVVTFTAVLWGNMLPLAYGKLHALTVICILAEPRIAQDRWHRDQESAPNPSGTAQQVQTPHMDYSQPTQHSGGGPRRRRHSTSSTHAQYVQTPHLPFDGDGYVPDSTLANTRVRDRNSLDPKASITSTSSGSRDLEIRPGMMSRKISEAPTACTCLSSGSTALGTPVWELDVEKKELAESEAAERYGRRRSSARAGLGAGLAVQVDPQDEGSFTLAHMLADEQKKG